MFEIRVAPARQFIQSTLAGFLSVEEVRRYASAMEAAHRRWVHPRSIYRLVIDASGAKIQAQDVLAAFAAHVACYPPAERIGVICGASLNRFQILRTLDRPYLRICDTLSDARRWALGDETCHDDELKLIASNGEERSAAA
jgi:hypothetical protein